MNEIVNVPEERTIGVITTEIKVLHAQAQQIILGYAIEIGRRLTEAKAMLPHGAWGDWLRDEVEFSKSTANNFMRIFDEYGASQLGLFGPEAKSQTLGNLSYTKALKLLAIPEEEREEFVEANDVENISSRELDRLIKERDQERAARQEAEKRAEENQRLLEAARSGQETMQTAFAEERKALADQAAEAGKQAQAQAAKLEAAQSALDKARDEKKKIKAQLKELKENPQISEEDMAQLRMEVGAEAKKEAEAEAARKLEQQQKEAEEQLQKAKAEAAAAREAEEAARKERDALEKKLAMADADTIRFKAQFERFQEEFHKCCDMLKGIEIGNAEMAGKLKKAMAAALDSLKERVGC